MNSATTDEKQYRLDGIKWLIILIMLGGAIFANYYYAEFPLLYRVAGLVASALLALFVAVQTSRGAAFWNLLVAAKNEMRRVTWPTRQERNQTTMIVLVVVLVMSLLLWGLDSLFSWLAVQVIG